MSRVEAVKDPIVKQPPNLLASSELMAESPKYQNLKRLRAGYSEIRNYGDRLNKYATIGNKIIYTLDVFLTL